MLFAVKCVYKNIFGKLQFNWTVIHHLNEKDVCATHFAMQSPLCLFWDLHWVEWNNLSKRWPGFPSWAGQVWLWSLTLVEGSVRRSPFPDKPWVPPSALSPLTSFICKWQKEVGSICLKWYCRHWPKALSTLAGPLIPMVGIRDTRGA